MYKSPSTLSEETRTTLGRTLNARLADGLDLHGQIKVAHWNVKGLHFAALHPLFETFAVSLAAFNDEIAERAVMFGAKAVGTARQVVEMSKLPSYPADTTRDVELIQVLADRFDVYLAGLHESLSVAEKAADAGTIDLLTRVIGDFEKNAWFLRASL